MQVQFQGHIRGNRRKLLGHHHLLALLLKRFAIPLARNFGGMIQRVLRASVFLNQLGRALFADALGAGNVVYRVAQQRHQINYFFGPNTEDFLHFFLVYDDVRLCAAGSRAQRSNVLSDQLHHVLVVADDQDLELFFGALCSQRANHVVRLVTLKFQDRQVHRFAQLSNVGNLHRQIIRHGRALRFVLFEKLVAKRRTLGVEDDAQVIRLIVFDEPAQNVCKKKRHLRGNSGGRVHAVHRRIERAVNVRHGVNQEEFFRSGRHAGEYSKGCRNGWFLAEDGVFKKKPAV